LHHLYKSSHQVDSLTGVSALWTDFIRSNRPLAKPRQRSAKILPGYQGSARGARERPEAKRQRDFHVKQTGYPSSARSTAIADVLSLRNQQTFVPFLGNFGWMLAEPTGISIRETER
jgi:hypothetical protein